MTSAGSIHAEEMIERTMVLRKAQSRWQKVIFQFVDSAQSQLFLMVLLLLSLFMADSWVVANASDSDNEELYGVLLAIFIIFMLETIVLSFVQERYFLRFFFWMDLIGTLSILLDIGWVSDSFLPKGGIQAKGSILRATRAAKLGARYGRLMRLLKLMRFLQYLPCVTPPQAAVDEAPSMSSVRKISRELNSLLTQQIAALVMILVIVVPFLSYSVIDHGANSFLITLANLASTNRSTAELTTVATDMYNFFRGTDIRPMNLLIESPYHGTPLYLTFAKRDVIREANTLLFSHSYRQINPSNGQWQSYNVELNMDNTIENQWESVFGIILIVLVIAVLLFFAASFATSIEKRVVGPVNKMMVMLRDSATVLLKSMKAMGETEEFKDRAPEDEYDALDEDIESELLEKMIEKLVRVMKHVIPNAANEIQEQDIDRATANWLTQAFTNVAVRRSVEVVEVVDEEAERIRLLELASTQSIVTTEELNSWDFDVLKYTDEECAEVIVYIFSLCNFIEEFKVPMQVFKDFVKEISHRYINTNTYHNFRHGCDVCHTVFRLLTIPQLNITISNLEFYSILVAALAHDVGHPGVNNLYLTKSKHKLALLHNDRSPLESMHCALLYEILSKPETNVMCGLSDPQWRESRKLILAAILGTDMSHHFEQISKTQLFLEVNGEDTKKFCRGEKDTLDCFSDEKNRIFVMELLLHCADISNPYKPWTICTKWTALVVEEFCLQGDREKSEGLDISPMCDRNAVVLCNMQMGFIEFVVTPLMTSVVNIFPPLFEIGQFLCANYCSWGERRKEEFLADDTMPNATKTEECRKIDERLQKYREKLAFVEELKAQPRRSYAQLTKKSTQLMQ